MKKVWHTSVFFWHLLMNLKNILIRETVEVGQYENKIILILTVLHFLKEIKKSTWIYHYFTPVYKKSCYMHVLPCLCTPLPLMNPKNKILKNLKKWRKKNGDIILFHMCTIKKDHIIHGSWNIRHNGQNFLSFWTIFCPFIPSPNNPKNQNFEKMKKNSWIHKWQSYDIWFLRHGV